MTLAPFFSFYGGKWRSAPKYPRPERNVIVEPFAGSAGYSTRYSSKKVFLVEKDDVIASVWEYLIGAHCDEIMCLPDIEDGQSVDDLCVCDGARALIGFWLVKGASRPNKTMSAWGRDPMHRSQFWGHRARKRIASQVGLIRHWEVIRGDYSSAPDIDATWFVDPPYEIKGKYYKIGSTHLDYQRLAEWCLSRKGQAIVCENTGASWLPFKHFDDAKANESKSGSKISREAIYVVGGHR